MGRLRSESLNLDHNKMSGAIPRQIECLTNLVYLSMQGNLLAGLLPSGIANLTNIGKFKKSDTTTRKKNPYLLLSLFHPETINLATNSLVGTIPEFTKLHRLINLFLFQNELSGGLPESIFDLDRLRKCETPRNILTTTLLHTYGVEFHQKFYFLAQIDLMVPYQ